MQKIMQLPEKTQIAGDKTVRDWNALKVSLEDLTDLSAWNSAYKEFYFKRLEYRYLKPINSIKNDGSYSGEGFSIMALICSLVEFLESTYQGINYRYVRKNDPPLTAFEYSSSSSLFISFLTLRSPFSKHFDEDTADEFYRLVRCGLLHEARTKGKWTVWGNSSKGSLWEEVDGESVVYRDNFLSALHEFIDEYKDYLLKSDDAKKAFIRKFDNLCEE